jgi:hypothetical protein
MISDNMLFVNGYLETEGYQIRYDIEYDSL